MVGHSQLESDILEASPPTMAAADGYVDEAVAEPTPAADQGPVAKDSTDDEAAAGNSGVDEALQGVQNSPDRRAAAKGSPMPVPQPGRKRKRSGLCRGGHQDAALVGPLTCCLCCSIFPILISAVLINVPF